MQPNQAGKYNKQNTPAAGRAARSLAYPAPAARLKPLVQAVALLLATSGAAQAQQAFSSAWFASKGATQNSAAATGYLPNGTPAALLTNPSQQQQQANAQLQRSINNLSALARGIAAQQAAQEAARQAALANGGSVPDGLADGGLKVDTNSLTRGWLNANAPTQGSANGKTTVTVQQTADRAILNWESFNVGQNTILQFAQQAAWSVLNRVNDPLARPSQIQGQINAPGTVLIVNRNGIVFSGSSHINVRNLAAAAATISDAQFQGNGIYGVNGTGASFTDANGKLIVEAGARINTAQPTSVTQGGGYVLLLGSEVSNAGTISTPKGQAELAAGDSFVIRKGYGTDANAASTTRGNEVAPQFNSAASPGVVTNTGLLTAPEGDVTLAGRTVQQNGVALATTTVNTRGTVHLLNSASDAQGSVTLGNGAYTAVIIDDDGKTTALNSQRDALIADSTKQDQVRAGTSVGLFDNLSKLPDRRDQSRVEIVSGGNINFEDGSLTLATGGQIAATASKRSFAGNGSLLDVSGAVGVSLPMSANGLLVNVQGNELRDAPVTRDSGTLANSNVWVDTSQLIYVPAGTGGYASDRWYTAGGLLEVGGYLANQGHRIGEWAAQGGSIALGGNEVITQTGSSINLSGGTLDVQTGYLNVTWLRGSDGQLYRVDTAPANLAFSGVYKGFEVAHARWGKDTTEYYANPLIAPNRILQNGYTVGRDAGRLIVDAPTTVLEGDIAADVYNGPSQTVARTAGVTDGYKLSQRTAALPAALLVGQYGGFGLTNGNASEIRLDNVADVTGGMAAGDALAADRSGTVWLDVARLSAQRLGGLTLVSSSGIALDAPLTLADGGQLSFTAPNIDIDAGLTIRGGSVALGNIMHGILASNQTVDQWWKLTNADGSAQVTLAAGANIDLRGVWTNAKQSPDQLAGLPYINGGSFSADGTGGIALQAGSVIDVSSGGAIQPNGKAVGGKGGNVSLVTNDSYRFLPQASPASLVLDGSIRAYGFNGGGALRIQAGQAVAFGETGDAATLALPGQLLQSGFTSYDITGMQGMRIASGAQLQPLVPVYRFNDAAYALATGGDIATTAELWLPPVYLNDPVKGVQTQRIGADLTLTTTRGDFNLQRQAAIAVDPGRAVNIYAYGQTTIDGNITAHGGSITVASASEATYPTPAIGGYGGFSLTRSIWIGEQAVLDVSGQANIELDQRGRHYGSVSDGGSIQLGAAADGIAGDAFVVIRPGALLNASGAAGVLDVAGISGNMPTAVASDGGSIALSSNSGIYIDGMLQAAAGGAGAAGGLLSMNLVSRIYNPAAAPLGIGDIPVALRNLRNITLTQARQASGLSGSAQAGQADAGLLFGSAAISAEQIAQGGFGSLALKTSDLFVFKGDLNLSLARSLTLSGGILTVDDATPDIKVVLNAPYARMEGFVQVLSSDVSYKPGLDQASISRKLAPASLTINADLIDVVGAVRVGALGYQGSGFITPQTPAPHDNTGVNGGEAIDAAGFAEFTLASSGDIRFANSRVSTDSGEPLRGGIKTGGNLNLTAAQVYPQSGAMIALYAGMTTLPNASEGFDPARSGTITIRRSGDALPPLPASAFGNLSLIASTIDQGGVVRAPLGTINFNSLASGFTVTPAKTAVLLRSGSVTSTSADGLLMPFGGTTDGVAYQGADGTFVDLGSSIAANGFKLVTGVSVSATSVVGEAGSLIDVSGGGTLAGAGFVSGRGGSVDVLKTALANVNPAYAGGSAKGNRVYAVVPGYASAYAPALASNGAGDPAVGSQITVPAGVPGLPAGTYTLLPSSYALLPGGFRVELGAAADRVAAPAAMPNGSYNASATLSVANTAIRDALPTQAIFTSGDRVRSYSQYNETSYADFGRSQAALFGSVRPRLPQDGGILQFAIGASDGATPSLRFAGQARFDPVGDGIDGSLMITSSAPSNILDITAPGAVPIAGHSSISSADIASFNPATLLIGGGYQYQSGNGNNGNGARVVLSGLSTVNLLDGAALRAGQVFVIGPRINVAGGASIDTRGLSSKGIDSRLGYLFGNVADETMVSDGPGVLAVANGWLNFLPVFGHASMTIASGATLLSEGSIVLGAPGSLTMGDVNFGARYLTVSQAQINAGDAAALAAAQAAGVLPPGWSLNQVALDRLLRPSAVAGAPTLERLTLIAGDAFNVFGSVALDARGQSGSAQGVEFVLNTPAIYGLGGAGDLASIRADRLVWNGIRSGNGKTVPYGSRAPAAIVAGGAGTGSGRLSIEAAEVLFGYDADSRPTDGATLDRVALGFSEVVVSAGKRITANSDGTLSVGLGRDGSGQLVGGNLTLAAPLISADGGATLAYQAGGAIRAVAPAGGAGDTMTVADQGGTLSFDGASIALDTAIALPSGKLSLKASGDVTLGANARIDLAGRTLAFYDVNKYGWGGDLVISSAHGDIVQNAGGLIDVSAAYNQAGSVSAIADDAAHGHIAFNGTLRGASLVSGQEGRIALRGQGLGDFAALNAMLNDSGFFGSRAFVLRQGDLAVGSEVRAHVVSISVDAGSLTVNGTIDAAGAAPGSIRLAARDNLTLAAAAVLDVHGTRLQTDSYGVPIEASNTAHVDLTAAQGMLTLAPGATIDMRSADGVARGKLELNAPRLGAGGSATGAGAPANATGNDIAIAAAGPLDIRGAGSIALNGFATYTNAPADPADPNGQLIDQDWLDKIHSDSTAFIDGALANAALQSRLAGLKAYGAAFHLRPGVEIASATPDGNLTIKGDLDFSNYRYGPGADTLNHSGLGEPGVINFRAGGNLTVNGSLNDGFLPPPASPDALTVLFAGALSAPYTVTTAGAVLGGGWMLNYFDDFGPAVTFGLPLPLGAGFAIQNEPTANHPLPMNMTLAMDFTIGGFGDTPLGGEIRAADGTLLYRATDMVPPGTVIPAGSVMGAGVHDIGVFPWAPLMTTITQWPANTDLYLLAGTTISQGLSLPVGTVLPANFSLIDITLTAPGDRKVWATSAMQAPGAQSWSMRLAAGADLGAADARALRTAAGIAAGTGNVVLNDPFNVNLVGAGQTGPGVSVVRTGTGSLEILAGGSYRQDSAYGVYTAGTAVMETGTAANAAYEASRSRYDDGTLLGAGNAVYEATLGAQRMYYTEHGGDVLLVAQGDIGSKQNSDSQLIGNWLLRQGGNGQATAWGINFGSYAAAQGFDPRSFQSTGLIGLDTFSGVGALGGGNVTLKAGGDIGAAGQGIVAAIGGSGRVLADGTLRQTGGGTLTVEAGRNVGTGGNQFVNLRGDINVAAGGFGSLTSSQFGFNGVRDGRPLDSLRPFAMNTVAGASFAPGDGAVSVRARGDLAMGAVDDPGRVGLGQYAEGGADGVQRAPWFTLWTGRTAVDLLAAGGDLSPLGADQASVSQGMASTAVLPSILRAAAASGSIYLKPGPDGAALMMPSPEGQLELLARGSIIEDAATGNAIGASSTSLASIPTPFNPAWILRAWNGSGYGATASNVWADPNDLRDILNHAAYSYDLYGSEAGVRHAGIGGTLFAFGANTVSDASAAAAPGLLSHLYAVKGDITGLQYGEVYVDINYVGNGQVLTRFYRAVKPVAMLAGGDIMNIGGMILHDDPTDISTLAASGGIFYAGYNKPIQGGQLTGLQIAGPGTLEITAGKSIYQGSMASIDSIGPLVSGDTRPGASVVVQAGVGTGAPGVGQVDWAGFAQRYLDPTNLAGAGPLADQPGKVAKTYGAELAAWLQQRFGYTGAAPLAYFNALPDAQQRVFLRQVYYQELLLGGREYNDPASARYGSYLRGRAAIAALFPADAYAGDITMFSAKEQFSTNIISGSVHTDFGGNIQLLAPGGKVVVGSDGLAPGADAGLITQGAGDIEVYSKGSLLLGLSRVMTTFGGAIQAWSAEGDINAGRGSKTTVLYTPPKRTYDDIGNVALAPQVPSNGAGIATLAPIPEVPPGDIDLIAPLGTIDAGEAGIRVSGNVNIAALQVVNAANIQVQGKSTGLPVVAAVNVGALTNASAAASSAAMAAQDAVARERAAARQNLPSVFTVRVLGFGNETLPPSPGNSPSSGYKPDGVVQVLGAGALGPAQMQALSPAERKALAR